jgi:cephalosporin hydroxylase
MGFFKDKQNVKCIIGNSLTVNVEDRDFDIILLDGSHTYEETLGELIKYVPMLRKGGYLMLHDHQILEVRNALEKYVKKYPKELRFMFNNIREDYMQVMCFLMKI